MVRTIFWFFLHAAILTLASATSVSAQTTPRRASGIDSIGAGGDLGGNTQPPATLVRIPNADDDLQGRADTQWLTLGGRVLSDVPRGQIVIVRRRTQGGYVAKKVILR